MMIVMMMSDDDGSNFFVTIKYHGRHLLVPSCSGEELRSGMDQGAATAS